MPAFPKPTFRIEDDKRGHGCHVVIDPNEYAPTIQVRFQSYGEARQWLTREFSDWYRRYNRCRAAIA